MVWRGVPSQVQEVDGKLLRGKLYGRAARVQRSRDNVRCISIVFTLCFALN
jgi:hypothetical protein